MKIFINSEINEMDRLYRVHFINSLAGFKSLNLVGTTGKNGIHNLCIVNSVIHIGANPPLMAFISRPPTVERHTLENILDTGFFTINHVNKDIYKKAHQTSAKYEKAESEFDKTGLSTYFSATELVKAPYVKESNVKIGLAYEDHLQIKFNNTILIIGMIKEVALEEEYLNDDGFVNISKAGTITNSGLDAYYETNLLSRLAYARPDEPIKEIVE